MSHCREFDSSVVTKIKHDLATSFVFFPTGFHSFRSRKEGSWYISTLCKKLKEAGKDVEFTNILTKVQGEVALRTSFSLSNDKCTAQKPCFISMLTKLLYFPTRQRHSALR